MTFADHQRRLRLAPERKRERDFEQATAHLRPFIKDHRPRPGAREPETDEQRRLRQLKEAQDD